MAFRIGKARRPTKADIALGSVDNTSDLEKPTSTATQEKLDATQVKIDAISLSTEVAPQLGGPLDANDNVIAQAELKDYSETIVAMAANDIDLAEGNVHTKAISTAVTLTFSNPPVLGKAGAFTLIATFSGSPVITWPTGVKWSGGTAPTLTAAGVDVFTFMTTDGGTNWFGFTSGADML